VTETGIPRFGIVRVGRPHPALANAEARVIARELQARLGEAGFDLRVDGETCGVWQPLAHASWPSSVDAVLDVGALWDASAPPLTALFARTVEPAAAEVRRRMLRHLGVIPEGAFELDDERWARLTTGHARPTDLWLVATEAAAVTIADPAVTGLATGTGDPAQAALDGVFDQLVAALPHHLAEPSAARRQARLADLMTELGEVRAAALRAEHEATARLDQLGDENRTLRERLARLDRS
jgi:hypothetical protein